MDTTQPGLTFDTFRATEADGERSERLDGWFDAQTRGFHGKRVDDEMRRRFRDHLVADDAIVRGAWPERTTVASARVPIATYASYDKTLNTGRGLLPTRMISDVTVSPAHRRRGLLRAMITADLEDAAADGLPLAALTVSEGSIYGRFGFGLATHRRQLQVDTTARFALRAPVDDGQVELAAPEEVWPVAEKVFAGFHATTRGSIDRPQFYEPTLTGAFDFREGPDRGLRAAVHLSADGEPDGHVVYKHAGRPDGVSTIEVVDLVATTPTAYLRLWRFLADIDLADRVTWDYAPVVDPLEWALVNPHALRPVGVKDLLWVRVLDVPVALEARPWTADADVVLEVVDPLGHAAGRYRLTVEGGRAVVSRTDDEPGVVLDADALGALYLGGVAVDTLRAVGRVTGADVAVRAFAAASDGGPSPYCLTAF